MNFIIQANSPWSMPWSVNHAPQESRGLYFAVQAILYHQNLIFLRVQEEGYSTDDYLIGVSQLKRQKLIPDVTAICLPGVGTKNTLNLIQDAIRPIYQFQRSIIIMNESDLYDYIMDITM